MANDQNFAYNPKGKIKNYESLRKMSYWAGGLGVAQAVALITITIIAILSYNCIMPLESHLSIGSLMDTIFYDLYFQGGCLPDGFVNYNRTILDVNPPILNPDQMLIFMCVYLGISACWLLASVVLLTDLTKDNMKKTVFIMCTWAIFTFCICAMDLVLGIIFGIDYGSYQSVGYGYNLNMALAGAIDPHSALLVAAMVVSASLMIIAFKGFILWFINVGLMTYFLMKAIYIATDVDRNETLFMPRKEFDEDILTTRAPIHAYEPQKRSTVNNVYNNDAYVSDSQSYGTIELNIEPIAAAARISNNVQDRRFRNFDAFQQFPPPRSLNSRQSEVTNNGSSFPVPDYSPPMSRHNNNAQNRHS